VSDAKTRGSEQWDVYQLQPPVRFKMGTPRVQRGTPYPYPPLPAPDCISGTGTRFAQPGLGYLQVPAGTRRVSSGYIKE